MNVHSGLRWLVAGAALLALSSAGCAPPPRRPAIGAGTTTAAEVGTYTPGSVVLYLARHEIAGACGDDLSPDIAFPSESVELTPRENVELEKWALCLQRPELQDANVVLVQPDGSARDAMRFEERARRLRDLLAARGIDPARVTIGAPHPREEGVAPSHANAIRLELTRPVP